MIGAAARDICTPKGAIFQRNEVKIEKIPTAYRSFDWTINTKKFKCVDMIDKAKLPETPGRVLISTENFMVDSFGRVSKWKIENAIYMSKNESEKFLAVSLFFLGKQNEVGQEEVDNNEMDVSFTIQLMNKNWDNGIFDKTSQNIRKFSQKNPALGFNKFLPLSKLAYPSRFVDVNLRLHMWILDTANVRDILLKSFQTMGINEDNQVSKLPIVEECNGDEDMSEIEIDPDPLPELLDDAMEVDEQLDAEPVHQKKYDWNSIEDRDLVLTISDAASIKVHSSVLAESSPVFKIQLDPISLSKLKKAGTYPSIPLIPITLEMDVIETFLKYLYDHESLKPETIIARQHIPLYSLAAYYEIESLKKHDIFGYLYKTEVQDSNVQFHLARKLVTILFNLITNPDEINNMNDEYFRLLRESLWRNFELLRETQTFKILFQPLLDNSNGSKTVFQDVLERLMVLKQ